MARLTIPINPIIGLILVRIDGNSVMSPKMLSSFGVTPKRTGACLRIIMIPIAANIPCTVELGKKSTNRQRRESAKSTWTRPAKTTTANVYLYPTMRSPCPSSITAAAAIEIKPAAGPLIVSRLPIQGLTKRPPIMAVIIPAIGGKPLARAIPKQSGKAIRKTTNPAPKSCFQFCQRPLNPSLGTSFVFFNVFRPVLR